MCMTEEQREIVEKNHSLIYYFLSKNNYDKEEFYDIAAIALCNAVMKYNKTQNISFSTYAYSCMHNACANEIRHQKTNGNIINRIKLSLDKGLYEPKDGIEITLGDCIISSINMEHEICQKLTLENNVKNAIKNLNDREKEVLYLLYEGKTQNDIGEVLGCSHTTVYNIRNTMRKKLRKHFYSM